MPGKASSIISVFTTSSKMLCSCVSIGTIESRPSGVPGNHRVNP